MITWEITISDDSEWTDTSEYALIEDDGDTAVLGPTHRPDSRLFKVVHDENRLYWVPDATVNYQITNIDY